MRLRETPCSILHNIDSWIKSLVEHLSLFFHLLLSSEVTFNEISEFKKSSRLKKLKCKYMKILVRNKSISMIKKLWCSYDEYLTYINHFAVLNWKPTIFSSLTENATALPLAIPSNDYFSTTLASNYQINSPFLQWWKCISSFILKL